MKTLFRSQNQAHLYRKEDDSVYLTLEDAEVELSSKGRSTTVTVRINRVLWEVIRQYSALIPHMYGKTDEEIYQLAEACVNAFDKDAPRTPDQDFTWRVAFGGDLDGPREKKVESCFEFFKASRTGEAKLHEEVRRMRTSWDPGPLPESPLAGIPRDAKIKISKKARKEMEKKLEKATRPYRAPRKGL